MAASLTGARYLRDAIEADSCQITGSATIGGSISVSGGLSGNGALLTGLWSPAPNASTSIGIAGLVSQLNQMVPTFSDPSQNETFNATAYSPTLKMWVVVGGVGLYSLSGTGKGLYTSPDGFSWTARVSPANELWNSVAWGNGLFVATSANGPSYGSTYATMTSADGINWTGHSSTIQMITNIIFNPDQSKFLASSSLGFAVSTDGATWSAVVLPLAGSIFMGLAWSQSLGLYAAVTHNVSGPTNAFAFTSPDGIVWTQRMGPSYGAGVFALCWSPELSLFVAMGYSRWFWSRDGIVWTGYVPKCSQGNALVPAGYPSNCIWDPDHAVFIAAGDIVGGLAISQDGFGWEHFYPPMGYSNSLLTSGGGFNTSMSGGFISYVPSTRQFLAVVGANPIGSVPYPLIFTTSFSGFKANVTQSTGSGFLGVGLGAVAPIQQLDVGGYVRVQHPYFWGLGVNGATQIGGIIGTPSSTLVSVGNACQLTGTQQTFYALANCIASVTCCSNVGPGGYLQLYKTNLTQGIVANTQVVVMTYPTTVLAQNTNYGSTFNYVNVSATVPMTLGEEISAKSSASIFDAGSSFSGAMLFAT